MEPEWLRIIRTRRLADGLEEEKEEIKGRVVREKCKELPNVRLNRKYHTGHKIRPD